MKKPYQYHQRKISLKQLYFALCLFLSPLSLFPKKVCGNKGQVRDTIFTDNKVRTHCLAWVEGY